MTLSSMLAAHDENVLIALSSKGLTRRAKRDVEAGKSTVVTADKETAKTTVDGETVTLDSKGPKQAKCSCPASGICRHILASVIMLREAETSPTEPLEAQSKDIKPSDKASKTNTPDTSTTEPSHDAQSPAPTPQKVKVDIPHVRDELLALTDAQIKKFAGADLQPAITLMASIEHANIQAEGLNLTVSIADSPAAVTFIAGQGLKGAVYKGPTTKARLITAAYVLLVRREAGKIFDISDIGEPQNMIGLTREALEEMLDCITSSVRAVLTGVPEIAADRLFDQAITARVQAAPRLTAQLRGLAKQATLATTRHVDYNPASFLEDAANCYALCHAIAHDPADHQLTGSLKRNYMPSDPMHVWMLGARVWRTPSGARGLTSYVYNAEAGHWYETTTARAAGMDLSFSAAQAYEGTLWRSGSPRSMMGKSVYLPAPLISSDFQISQTAAEASQPNQKHIPIQTLENSSGLITNWAELRRNIMGRIGLGIRRRIFPVPVLIKPHRTVEISFDELGQRYKWTLMDDNNAVIHLDLPADHPDLAKHLRQSKRKVHAILLVAHLREHGIHYEPVSLFLEYKKSYTVLNIRLDDIEYRRLVGRKSFTLKDFIPRFESSAPAVQDFSTQDLLNSVLDTLVDITTSPARLDRLEMLQSKCEQGGFIILADMIAKLRQNPTDDQILKTTYVLNETRYLSLLTDKN